MHRFKLLILALVVILTAILPGVAGATNPTPWWESCAVMSKRAGVIRSSAARVYGTSGNDIIILTGSRQTVYAGAGDDFVCGSWGPDKLYGQAGNDLLWGLGGSDKIVGGSGWDVCGVIWGYHDKPRFAPDGDDHEHDNSCEWVYGNPRKDGR